MKKKLGCNKHVLAAIVLISIVFISGCSSIDKILPGGKKADPDKPAPVDIDFHKGTDGLVLEFVENMPPAEVWVGDTFNIGIGTRNKGAYDIANGKVLLINPHLDFMRVPVKTKVIEELIGKSLRDAEGGYQQYFFTVTNTGLPSNYEAKDFLFKARGCFQYKTEASADICISTHRQSRMTEKPACTTEDITISAGQGAPIAITKIEQQTVSRDTSGSYYELVLVITYENKGKGLVTNTSDYLKKCNGKPVFKDELTNIGYSVRLSNQEIVDCKSPRLDLEDKNKATITCSKDLEATPGYVTPLIVELDYGYVTQDITKTVKVKKTKSGIGLKECNPDNCIESCTVFGGIDTAKVCEEAGTKCCKRSKGQHTCSYYYSETHECRAQECGLEDIILNACPKEDGEKRYCCKKESTKTGSTSTTTSTTTTTTTTTPEEE